MSKQRVTAISNGILRASFMQSVVSSNEDIHRYVDDEIGALLTKNTTCCDIKHACYDLTIYKRPHDLDIEHNNCMPQETDYHTCSSIKRIKIIMKAYQRWIKCRRSYTDISAVRTLTFRTVYTFTEINNDFNHIKQHMNYNKITQDNIRKIFTEKAQSTTDKYRRLTQQATDTQHAQIMDVEDSVYEQEFHKIYSYLTHSNIDKTATNNKTMKQKWWQYTVTDDDYKGNIHNDNVSQNIYRQLVQNMGIFRWQNSCGFSAAQHHSLMYLKPRYDNTKDEVLHNPYFSIEIKKWNETYRKSTIFFNSFDRKRIRTRDTGAYYDTITALTSQWNQGEIINLREIVTVKLYTDLGELQKELKKCFRFDTIETIFALNNFDPDANHNKVYDANANTVRYQLERRLCAFYWWRSTLLTILHKYASKLNGSKTLYHGVDAQKILNNSGTQTLAFCGPLSTSSSYHVADTFATTNGMVLQITTQFPRAGLCKAFDASIISDYPEEQEWLLSFAYLRITKVFTKPLLGMEATDVYGNQQYDLEKVPLESKAQSIFFALQLFRHQFFSMSAHLEYWLSAFLYLQCGYNQNIDVVKPTFVESLERIVECENYDLDKDLYRYHQILSVLWKKFENFRLFPNHKQVVRLDVISETLKPYFMDFDAEHNTYVVSFDKMVQIFENVKEVHFINQYVFDDAALHKLILYLNQNTNHHLETVKFLYYDYDAMCHSPRDPNIFCEPDTLDIGLRTKLTEKNWNMKHKKIGNTGYQIVLSAR